VHLVFDNPAMPKVASKPPSKPAASKAAPKRSSKAAQEIAAATRTLARAAKKTPTKVSPVAGVEFATGITDDLVMTQSHWVCCVR
jgi:hypothetical protein